jgi:MFS family permease
LLIAGSIQTLTSLVLATAVVTDSIAYWMLIVASVIQGGVISLLGPARLAFIAETVERGRMTNAILLSQSSMQLTRVLGPATAGALIGVSFFGVGGVYFLAAAASAGGLVMTLGLPEGRPKVVPTNSAREDLADGVRYVRGNRRLSRLLLLSFGVVLVGFPHIAFLPVVAEDLFDAGSTGFGLLTTAAAVGALATSLALTGVAKSRLGRIQALAAVGFGVALALFGLAPLFGLALAIMVVIGATSAAFQALNNSLVLSIAPVEYHGRVQSLLMLGFSGFGFAALPLGIIADSVGLRPTMTAMGIGVTLIALASILVERRRAEMEVRL